MSNSNSIKVGSRFGMLVIKEQVEKPKNRHDSLCDIWYLCQCDCGNQIVVNRRRFYGNRFTKSCGCLKKRTPIYDKNKIEISNSAGIYGFQNRYNGKWYIGKTKNLYQRYQEHFNRWRNDQTKQFYQAIKKYGWDSFNYYILKEYLEIPKAEELSREEEYWIKEKDSFAHGYNASEHSSGGFYSKEHEEKCTKILEELNQKQKNENHPRTDFSKEEILEIFDYAMRGAPVRQIYNLYKDKHNITYNSFQHIYQGKHFKDYLPKNWENRPMVTTNSKLWGEEVIEIKKRFLNGETVDQVYKDYKDRFTRKDPIMNIYLGKTYKNINPCID